MNQSGRVANQINNQKILFVTQRPPTPGGSVQPSSQPQQSTVVKFVSNTSTMSQQKIITSQKIIQGNQPPVAVVQKNNFQNQNKPKSDQMQPSIDDLSHLV